MNTNDHHLPARAVRTRFGVCDRTIDRWVANPALGFPKPLTINGRRYWKAADVERWEESRMSSAA